MSDFFVKRGYHSSVGQVGHDRAQEIDRHLALKTSQNE